MKAHQMASSPTAPIDLSGRSVSKTPPENSTKCTNTSASDAITTETDTTKKFDYGQPVFPTAKQILPLHSGFSDAESMDGELPYIPTISSDKKSSNHEETADEIQDDKSGETDKGNINIKVSQADIITRDCKVLLRELSTDKIDLWTKREILPEFPEFVEGRNIGGHNIRLKTTPTRHNPRPSHSSNVINYVDLDDHSDSPSPKRPAKRTLNEKKDGPTADRIAA